MCGPPPRSGARWIQACYYCEIMRAGIQSVPLGQGGAVFAPGFTYWQMMRHRVVFMDHGRIVEDERKDDFFDRPRSQRAQQFLARILQH